MIGILWLSHRSYAMENRGGTIRVMQCLPFIFLQEGWLWSHYFWWRVEPISLNRHESVSSLCIHVYPGSFVIFRMYCFGYLYVVTGLLVSLLDILFVLHQLGIWISSAAPPPNSWAKACRLGCFMHTFIIHHATFIKAWQASHYIFIICVYMCVIVIHGDTIKYSNIFYLYVFKDPKSCLWKIYPPNETKQFQYRIYNKRGLLRIGSTRFRGLSKASTKSLQNSESSREARMVMAGYSTRWWEVFVGAALSKEKQKKKNESSYNIPYHQCMVYLPTFTIKIKHS